MNSEPQNSSKELTRRLGFKDLFFLSFGGMSPLLSIITYGAFAYTLAGADAPIVMIIGTLLVLLNGLVVTKLSGRFSSSGGYYTYAFQALSARIGFDTGWMYIFYSILYGLAYLMGAVFIINLVFGISIYLAFAIIVIPSITFLIIGIRASSTYALYAVILEISVMIVTIILSIIITKGSLYVPNPSVYHITTAGFFLGILFAMGIPTGYGSIAPVSGEVIDPKKNVGRSVISVIIIGGTLATLMIYSIANVIIQKGITISSSEQLPVVSILKNDFGKSGIYLYYAIGLASINDAILAILSFGSAASRTIFRMGVDRSFPGFFSRKDKRGNPLVAIIFTCIIMLVIPILFLLYSTPETAFIVLGTISSLGGLFIHISANFSLIRIGLRRGRRLALRAGKSIINNMKNYNEFILAVFGAVISTVVMIYSAYSTVQSYTTLFLAWIVTGFILSEVRSIVTKAPYEMDISKEGEIVAKNLEDLTVNDSNVNTVNAVFTLEDTAKTVLDGLTEKHLTSAVIVDSRQNPVGILNIVELLLLPKSVLNLIKVSQIRLSQVVTIEENKNIPTALRYLKENNVETLAIVDSSGKCIGSLSSREILSGLGTVVSGTNIT